MAGNGFGEALVGVSSQAAVGHGHGTAVLIYYVVRANLLLTTEIVDRSRLGVTRNGSVVAPTFSVWRSCLISQEKEFGGAGASYLAK